MTESSQVYAARLPTLELLAERLQDYAAKMLADAERLKYVRGRAKTLERFLLKASKVNEDGTRKYDEPITQIQDQVGIRVVTNYLSDVEVIGAAVNKYFRGIEDQLLIPDDDREFGYVGRHFILVIPTDVTIDLQPSEIPQFFELQVHTLFQHAWAEAEHDLGYKPAVALSSMQKRRIAFTAAQAWGADQVFDELFRETHGQDPTSAKSSASTPA